MVDTFDNEKGKKVYTPLNKPVKAMIATVAGIVIATMSAPILAKIISNEATEVLFINSLWVNILGLWLFIASFIMMTFGDLVGSIYADIACKCSGLSLFLLYMQYCRLCDTLKHPFLVTIGVGIVCLVAALMITEKPFSGANFLTWTFMGIMLLCGVALIYIFFTRVFGFSKGFWIIATSLLAFGSAYITQEIAEE